MTREQADGEVMAFPATWEEWERQYGFNDRKEVYTNGSKLIPCFRVRQWLEHIQADDGWSDTVLMEKALNLQAKINNELLAENTKLKQAQADGEYILKSAVTDTTIIR